MRMDPSIILSGRPVNALGALSAGTQAGVQAGEAQQRGGLLNVFREQGPGIMQGDQNALAALAQFDPQAALGVEETRLGMDATRQDMAIQREQLEMAREQGRMAAVQLQQEQDAAALAAEMQQVQMHLPRALAALQMAEQDPEAALAQLNQIFAMSDQLPQAGSIEEAAMIVAGFEGALEVFEGAQTLTGGAPPVDPGAEDDLRTEFSGDRVVREFQQQAPAFRRILAAGEDPSAAGDMALIFNFMKLLDPGSTVREGEFATAQNAGGVDSRIRSLYNSVMDGTRLDERQRADFLDRAQRLYLSAEQGFNQVRGQYESLAERRGMNPDGLLIDYRVGDRLMTADPGADVTFEPPPGVASPAPEPSPAATPAPSPQGGGRPVTPGDALAGQEPPPEGFPPDIWQFLRSEDARGRAARLWAEMTPEERAEYIRRARGEE